jgi:glutathione S-transferase
LIHTDFFMDIQDQAMKLIGSYTSPFVRKISILLLEKGIEFEFINEQPYNAENGVAQYNPLGKVPALVTDEGECWFDSPIIADYIELLGVAPRMLPADPKAALAIKQIEALADGIMDAGLASVREQARPAAQQSETELLRQREKISRSLDMCEQLIRDGKIKNEEVNLATIAIACAIGYLNFRRVSPGWCVERPQLVKLAETLFQRESFAQTEPPKA